jgi:hypothetical protein
MHSNFTVPNGWGSGDEEPSEPEPRRSETELGAIMRIAEEMGQRERSLALVILQAISAWNSLNTDRRAA